MEYPVPFLVDSYYEHRTALQNIDTCFSTDVASSWKVVRSLVVYPTCRNRNGVEQYAATRTVWEKQSTVPNLCVVIYHLAPL